MAIVDICNVSGACLCDRSAGSYNIKMIYFEKVLFDRKVRKMELLLGGMNKCYQARTVIQYISLVEQSTFGIKPL